MRYFLLLLPNIFRRMERKDNLLELVGTAWRWRKPIIAVGLIAAVGSIVISLMLPVYYEASTLFLAASPDQSKPEVLYSQGNLEPDYYGDDTDIDRLLTLARSRVLVDFLVERFDLMAHYDIDPGHRRAAYRVREALLDLYEVTKTERDAIEIRVQDRDPQQAADMANAARDKLDELAQGLIRSRQDRVLLAYRENVRQAEAQLGRLADSLTSLRSRYGIYNVEAQSESLTEQLTRAEGRLASQQARLSVLRGRSGVSPDTLNRLESEVSGQRQLMGSLNRKIDLFNAGIASFTALSDQFEELSVALGEDQERLQQLQSTYSASFPAIILVEPASVPDIKAWPRRSLIVLGATFLALLFSLAAALLIDGYREIDWRNLTDDPAD